MYRSVYFILFSVVIASVSCSDIGDAGINTFAASRSLLETEAKKDAKVTSNGTVFNVDNCTIIYTRGLKAQVVSEADKEKKVVDIFDFSSAVPKVTGKCNNSTKGPAESKMTVDYKLTDANVTGLQMVFTFNASANGRWSLSELLVSLTCAAGYKGCTSFKDVRFIASSIASERGFSYHCTEPNPYKAASQNATKVMLSFNKIQVQPFSIEGGRFSHADDCVGFFSMGVWSGLFVSLLLTLIFAYGIIMINNITVTDRFDDPKGPGIQVNVQE